MKLKALILALCVAFTAIPANAFFCYYSDDEYYTTFYSIFRSKRGDNVEFIKFCYEDGVEEYHFTPKRFEQGGHYVPTSAAKFNRFGALKYFMSIKGFDDPQIFDAKGYDGSTRTALQYAAIHGNYEMVKFLLDKGASPIKKDPDGRYDALDYAKISGVKSVIDLLEKAHFKAKVLAETIKEERLKEIKSINMNDYEKFLLKYNLNSSKMPNFFS